MVADIVTEAITPVTADRERRSWSVSAMDSATTAGDTVINPTIAPHELPTTEVLVTEPRFDMVTIDRSIRHQAAVMAEASLEEELISAGKVLLGSRAERETVDSIGLPELAGGCLRRLSAEDSARLRKRSNRSRHGRAAGNGSLNWLNSSPDN